MKMLTPAELREFGNLPDNMVIPITAEVGPMLADALEIADVHAACLLESCTTPIFVNGKRRWCDSSTDDGNPEDIEQAIRYLEARGLLERHPEKAHLVQPRND